MIRRPPRSTRTDTLFPYTTLFRSAVDPEIGASYSAIAMVQSYVDHDWAGAEASWRRDMRLNPGSANIKMNLGSLLLMAGCPEEALDLLKQGLALDPLARSKERRVGKGCDSPCKTRWTPTKNKKKKK